MKVNPQIKIFSIILANEFQRNHATNTGNDITSTILNATNTFEETIKGIENKKELRKLSEKLSTAEPNISEFSRKHAPPPEVIK